MDVAVAVGCVVALGTGQKLVCLVSLTASSKNMKKLLRVLLRYSGPFLLYPNQPSSLLNNHTAALIVFDKQDEVNNV